MSLLLTHAYFIEEDPKEQAIMKPYPPLGLLCISAFLQQKGLKHSIFDTTFSSKAKFRQHLLENPPKYIAFYVNLMTRKNVVEAIRFIRTQDTLKNVRIVLGGPEVTYHADAFLGEGADVIVIGEGEETLYDLISTWETPFNPFLDHVDGIVFRNALGETVRTKEREKIKNLDALPFPNRGAIDLQLYLDAWKNRHGRNALSVSTMRGCPYTCKWCSRAVYGLSYRRRSPEKVAEEMVHLKEKYNPDSLWFVDDVFTVSHKWLRGFAEALRETGVSIPYECITRADRMNEEVVALLKETGCFRVWIGAESGSQKVLDLMDRRVKAETVREMIRLSQAHGIEAGTFIMLGYPGEEKQDIVATRDHLKAAPPDYFTITLAYPIAGTPFFEEVEHSIENSLGWENSSDRDNKFDRPFTQRYYDMAVRWIVNEVNAEKARQKGRIPSFLISKSKSMVARFAMHWS